MPAVGVTVAMNAAIVEAYGSERAPQEQGGTPLVAAIVIAAVVIGIGGLGVAEGTRSLLITSADLPDGYVVQRRMQSSSLSTCGHVEGWPGATRTLIRSLAARGLQRCDLTQYRYRDAATSSVNRPTSQAFVMRDDEAASQLLRVLRRLYLATIDPDGGDVKAHSLPVPDLGDQATRGATLRFSYPRHGGVAVTFWVYWWRRANVAAWVAVSDAVGDFDPLRTLELAHAIDARLSD